VHKDPVIVLTREPEDNRPLAERLAAMNLEVRD
jgi:hypothetical protein